jgi:hypothetical protein
VGRGGKGKEREEGKGEEKGGKKRGFWGRLGGGRKR